MIDQVMMNFPPYSIFYLRAVHCRGVACCFLSQSGSGKTRLVRSAQLRHIWRDAADIQASLPTEETKEDGLKQHDDKGDIDDYTFLRRGSKSGSSTSMICWVVPR